MTEKAAIGFIGVGLMGHGMAKNLVEKGHPLAVLAHRNRAPVEDLVARGAFEAGDIAELAARSEVIFLCLPGSPEVERAVGEILAAGAEGKTVVDCSTANPVSTRALAARMAEAGGALCDAPLSRTPAEAWEGTLDVMAGAPEDLFARLEPILSTFATKVVRVGDVGAGHTMKLVNNFLSLGYGALYAEALAIGARNGIDAATVEAVVGGGRMDCGFFQTFMRHVVHGDKNAHRFALRNAHKDMRYVVGLANESGIASHVSSAVKNSYATAEATGHGEDYLPEIAAIVARLNGIGR
ncbi:NAD(P)-dependent oxidoreductase [Stappia sp.]|uniref:NAD(P)-dependent oxidoreductase n=1 Tax=Stappia sp. TaxID=1870903 RepID=UPI003A9A2B43